jgi:hypothetical protein
MKKFYVYVYLNPLKTGIFDFGDFVFYNEPFYVGKGCYNRIDYHFNKIKLHLETGKKIREANLHKFNTIAKIINAKKEPIRIKVSIELTEDDALELEVKLIETIGRNDLKKGPLTNLTDGGEKIKLTPEQIQKIVDHHTGSIRSEETRRNISLGKIGKKFSKNHKENMKHKRIPTWCRKKIIMYEYDKIIKIFNSIDEASKELKISRTTLSKHANGNIKRITNGITWKFE